MCKPGFCTGYLFKGMRQGHSWAGRATLWPDAVRYTDETCMFPLLYWFVVVFFVAFLLLLELMKQYTHAAFTPSFQLKTNFTTSISACKRNPTINSKHLLLDLRTVCLPSHSFLWHFPFQCLLRSSYSSDLNKIIEKITCIFKTMKIFTLK